MFSFVTFAPIIDFADINSVPQNIENRHVGRKPEKIGYLFRRNFGGIIDFKRLSDLFRLLFDD